MLYLKGPCWTQEQAATWHSAIGNAAKTWHLKENENPDGEHMYTMSEFMSMYEKNH